MSIFADSLQTPGRLRAGRFLCCAAASAGMLLPVAGGALAEALPNGAAIQEDLRCFREMGSVLYVAAHPDDENTQLITWLARGRGYRTAYLSVTRGDGGQNVLGPAFGEKLGVARTQELLAARRIDGGQQFFTRAIDFGFSKDYEETLSIWNKDEVLSDIVRVIRTFRPDVIVTRFSPRPGGTHGHHTASAVLAVEAFRLAGDPKAFPDQGLPPWKPKRILQNGRGRGDSSETGGVQMEIRGDDLALGVPFGEIAGRSRAMHRTQGFGAYSGGGRGTRSESFQLLDGEPATGDILEGVDTTWGRIQGGAEIGRMADEMFAGFNPEDPAASVPALLKLRSRLIALPADPLVTEKSRSLDRILQACLGLEVETVIPRAEVVPGETLDLRHTAVVRSSIPVRWVADRYPAIQKELRRPTELRSNEPVSRRDAQTLPVSAALTHPYWLVQEPEVGTFRVANPALIGTPENAPEFPVEHVFEVAGQTLVIPDEPVAATDERARRPLDVIPPVSLQFVSDVRLFAPETEKTVDVEVIAFRSALNGELRLEAPDGWSISPASRVFRLENVGDRERLTFSLKAPAGAQTAAIHARARIEGAEFGSRRVEVNYDHIPLQLLHPPARLKAVSLDLATRGHKIGYLAGAGDDVAESLEQMGYAVTMLSDADLTAERLNGLDAVVIGIRAFNVLDEIGSRMPALFGYAEGGGTVIVQYNRPNGLKTDQWTPFPLRLSNDRVTDENAPVTFLAPDHPVLNAPNRITEADFKGWVQERGLYFANQWDERFVPILACNDAGEPAKSGGLLIAPHGKGYFVYTGLAWFRQLPEGVPGAYRLFANLVSLGK